MEITENKMDNCTVVGISGRLDTTNYSILEKRLMDMIANQQDRIIVECSNMDYVSSSGLRILLMALKKITQLKGKFMLCGLQDNIREIFEISGFTNIFEIHPNQEDALKAF